MHHQVPLCTRHRLRSNEQIFSTEAKAPALLSLRIISISGNLKLLALMALQGALYAVPFHLHPMPITGSASIASL